MPLTFTDEKLHQKAIASTKRKFAIYPSAYANAWMVREYKRLYREKKGRSNGAFKGRSDANEESLRQINTRLRLDSWKRIGVNQRGKPCDEGRGWIGVKGSCKRSKKSLTNEQKTKLRKESAVGLADKIRAKKGMRDRNAPKIKKKPHELSMWEWANTYRPEVVARLEAGWASQGTRKGNTQASADLIDEHKTLVEKALARGEKVEKSILSEHQVRTASESWRSEKGRIALSMDRTIVAFKDDQSMGLKVKPKPEEIANILIENNKREVDVKFRSRSDRETKSFMKRIEAIAELAGYSATSPSGRVEQGYDFPEQYVVTLHLKRPSSSTNRSDSLKTWFTEDWQAINSSGKIVGECGSGETKGKVKCLPASKARSLSKRDRSTLAKRKQRNDPKPGRSGVPVMVSSKLDSMDPARLARAIVSIERKYGLRLNARLVWLHMDSTPCGKGWVGTKPGCERAKGGDEGDAPDVVKGKHAIGPELLTRLEAATSTSILSGNKEIQKLESLFNKIFDKDPVESFNSPEFKALAKAEKDATKGREDALAVMNEVLDKLSQITRARAAKLVSGIEIGNSLAKNAQEIREYLIEYAQLSGGLPKSLKKIFATSPRAYVNMDAGIVNLEKESSSSRRKSTLFHEVGHFGEMDGVLDRRMSKWRNDRATGPEDTLNNIANKGSNLVKQFDDDEMGVPGPFVDVYVGKTYTDGFTEVFSMGMERMISPETMLDFYKDDPDHFFLTVGASRHG